MLTWLVDIYNTLFASGFFEQGEWCQNLAGTLTNNSATGGPLDAFEVEVGQSFPDLQAKRQAVVDAWRSWQSPDPWYAFWLRPALLEEYREQCREFAEMVDAKREEYLGGEGPVVIGGVWPWIKTNWKILAVTGSILAVGITAAVAVSKKK
ncbi:hypothetical protein ES703_16077 [subsurface metagenome]